MPKIIVVADASGNESGRVTLSERIVPENLESAHYNAQLLQRLSWATADAATIEVARSRHSAARRPAEPFLAGSGERSEMASVGARP